MSADLPQYHTIWIRHYTAYQALHSAERARWLATEAAALEILQLARSQLGLPPLVPALRLRFAHQDGWGLVVFGLITLLFAVPSDWLGLLMGTTLCGAGWAELRGLRAFLANQPARPLLVGSQVTVLTLVCGYALYRFAHPVTSDTLDALRAAGMEQDLTGTLTSVAQITYTAVLGASFLYQGGLARYYWRQTQVRLAPPADSPTNVG